MKKILVLFLALAISLSLCCCSFEKADGETTTTTQTTEGENKTTDEEAGSKTESAETTTAKVTETDKTTAVTTEEQTTVHVHTPEVVKGKEATCKKTGLTDGERCSTCGEILVEQTTTEKTAHKYVDTVVKPTLTTEGYTLHKCSVCGKSYKDTYTLKTVQEYSAEALKNMGLGFELQSRTDTKVCDGVTYSVLNYKDKNGTAHVAYVVSASPDKVSLELGFPEAAGKLNGISTVYNQTVAAKKAGLDVIASINADLFTYNSSLGTNLPNGTTILNGTLLRQDTVGYQGFALMKDGTYRFSNNATEFVSVKNNVKLACGGRYLVMKDGKIYDNGTADSFCTVHHPRTAFGVKRDGTMLFVVVDGRQAGYSDGATLLDLSVIFVHLGACDAINLDGGGSTHLYLKDSKTNDYVCMNKPTENRKVVNTLFFVKK